MARKVFIGKKTRNKINTAGVDVGTSVVQLSSDTRPLDSGVQMVADADNGGIVYVGVRSNITAGTYATDGFPLSAGESLLLPVDSESEIYLIGDQASLAIHFVSF